MSMCDYCKCTPRDINVLGMKKEYKACMQPSWHIRAVQNGDMYCDHIVYNITPRISMSMTTSPFVTKNKYVTRRNWTDRTTQRFQKGTLFKAVRSNYGGEVIGIGEITDNPYKQNTGNDITLNGMIELHRAEGFRYLDEQWVRINDWKLPEKLSIESLKNYENLPLIKATYRWINSNQILTVVPFKVIEVFPGMEAKYTTEEEIVRCVKALQKAIG